jgi:hypothetical protein
VQRQELLTKSKIFQDEIPTRTQGADNPADQVPEPQEHGRNLIERSGNKTDPKSFILGVHDILMRDRCKVLVNERHCTYNGRRLHWEPRAGRLGVCFEIPEPSPRVGWV